MTRVPYKWSADKPPAIRPHSIAKLEVLRDYLLAYFHTLVTPHQDELRLTLVDGFSGGGLYQHEATRQVVLGSPLVLLEAATEAEALIKHHRHKPFRINADYFFVDEDLDAISVLETSLRSRGYGDRIGKDIFLVHDRFEVAESAIRASILRKNPRSGRSLFFLDQYGYQEVPTTLIKAIFRELPAAEVIFTFN